VAIGAELDTPREPSLQVFHEGPAVLHRALAHEPGTAKRTQYVGKLINKYVYEQLPPGVLEELQELNPVVVNGRRRHKHHQHLRADTGNQHLDRQISTVTTLLRISKDKTEFEDLFERAFPPAQARLPLVLDSVEAEN
jgi:P63C domain